MNRKSTIASSAALIAFACACAWPATGAAGTLLSGYGGPGAGEQAIVGATLLGSGGSSGHGGSTGRGGSAGGESLTQGSQVGHSGASGQAMSSNQGAQGGSSGSPGGHGAHRSGASSSSPGSSGARPAGSQAGASSGRAFVYPSALRSTRSSSTLGLSGGDWLLVLAIVAALAAIGVTTVRISRLQR